MSTVVTTVLQDVQIAHLETYVVGVLEIVRGMTIPISVSVSIKVSYQSAWSTNLNTVFVIYYYKLQ